LAGVADVEGPLPLIVGIASAADFDSSESAVDALRFVTLSWQVSVGAAFGSACTRVERLRAILRRVVDNEIEASVRVNRRDVMEESIGKIG